MPVSMNTMDMSNILGRIPFLRSTKGQLFSSYEKYSRNRLQEIDGPGANLYDCFMFWKEYEILDLRLNELDDIVDYFVIVEANETFQGESKPLYFDQNRDCFSEFEEKIIHHVVEYPEDLNSTWERESYLRDSISQALRKKTDINRQDEIIISDVDEIPDPIAIRRAIDLTGVKIFSQSLHWYFYNYIASGNSYWFGPVMARFDEFTTPSDFRNRFCHHYVKNPSFVLWELKLSLWNQKRVRIIPNGGWHFSYIGDTKYIIEKLETFSHSELNTDEFTNESKIRKAMENGVNFVDNGWEFDRVTLDNSFPKHLLRNMAKFEENIAK